MDLEYPPFASDEIVGASVTLGDWRLRLFRVREHTSNTDGNRESGWIADSNV
jgi:hypothetical protein